MTDPVPLHPQMLLAKVERFLASTKMSAATFGLKGMGDPRFVYQLRKGREPRSDTVAKAIDLMNAYPKARWDLEEPAKKKGKAA